MPRDSCSGNSLPRDSCSGNSLPRDSSSRDSLPRDSSSRNSLPRDSSSRDSLPRDSGSRDPTPCPETPAPETPCPDDGKQNQNQDDGQQKQNQDDGQQNQNQDDGQQNQGQNDGKQGHRDFYPVEQHGARLSIALENSLRELVADSQLLRTSVAFKTFLHGDRWTSHETAGQSYRDAVETAFEAAVGENNVLEERVAAGCSVEHQVGVTLAKGEKQLVVWKFASQGAGLVSSAEFSSGADSTEGGEVDPYSVSSNDVAETEEDKREVTHYRTRCDFPENVEEASFVYEHFVAEKTGELTLQWENTDMSSVVSKPLRFQVKLVSLSAAEDVLEVAESLNAMDTAKWLEDHVSASDILSADDLPGWANDESEDGFGEAAYDDSFAGEGPEKDSQIQSAVLEERNHELEAQARLEESLAASKRELKSALDRVQIAEEIYKANLETITQLECGGPAQKATKIAAKTTDTAAPPAATLSPDAAQQEGTPSSELERVQRLCAGFQEQCLWRSVENMELEAQLAASQVEATSWREKHTEQAAQLEALEQQNRTLRTHKKMLVQEVKRLQPYSHVNLAALVQEVQEARMVQRSLQAKLDSHEQANNPDATVETNPTDFVFVEASENEEPLP
ncbi:unnamed protein product [Phytophthora lilii]|uniref:Unnamed protein product n=1 Tax=Phytophthora lilii TaxID=2077276 RepID=A0A9W6X302_9STRA|nr:unnamed protein product [Phytophthora lilii]